VAHRSEPRFLVLHGLRLKGFAEAGPVAEGAGLDAGEAEDHLRSLAGDGLVSRRDGRVSGWSLTPDGRSEHRRLVGEELEAAGAKAVVHDAYRQFLDLNGDLLAVCTAWQLRPDGEAQVVNDHSDRDYDREVVGRLAAVDEGARPITDDLSAQLDRYGRYASRLGAALDRVRAGEPEWFTKPIIDSYHTVWFELHEDLLCTLALERSAEGEG
jgi:DNA-binding MarR family transcriptional regulator